MGRGLCLSSPPIQALCFCPGSDTWQPMHDKETARRNNGGQHDLCHAMTLSTFPDADGGEVVVSIKLRPLQKL